MIVAIAGDHGGFALKQRIREHLIERGIKIADLGTDSEESVDYPEFGKACAQAVASGKADRGIVICGTGIGISIAANRIRGIRCGLCTSVEMAELSRKHNNANMLAMGGRITSVEDATRITDAWLDTEFEGGRHSRRVDMLDSI